ncbi:MAG: rane fusion protein multidrug efflux system [Rhodospirillaceae bacterium]|jgi:multidrug efflux system membrane fusion protein|nr:rane fusion protein multidrug efflux system [Rhodospirillaceae bacterium]
MSSPGTTRAFLGLLLVAGIIGAGYVLYSNRPSVTASASRPATSLPVAVAPATRGPFEVRAHTIGTVSVDASVQVKARVDGQVIEANFAEGQIVKKGDLLFRLDPALFQAQLRQAQAALARDQAQLANAQADQKRFTNLAKQGFATTQQQEQSSAQTKVLTAAIAADQAAIDIARLQLSYTEIRAPLDGKTGRMLIHPGNLVKGDNSAALVVINQLQPIAVDFSLPQQDLPSLQRRLAAGKLKVLVSIPGDPRPRLRGKVDFINNAIDAASGTIALKAMFDNEDLRLLPGQLVDVNILLQTIDDALTVPSEAVNEGQNGQYIYALAADGTAAVVPVKVSHEEGGRSVIDGDLKPGDKVVIDGQLRLGPGAKVTIKSDAGA